MLHLLSTDQNMVMLDVVLTIIFFIFISLMMGYFFKRDFFLLDGRIKKSVEQLVAFSIGFGIFYFLFRNGKPINNGTYALFGFFLLRVIINCFLTLKKKFND